MSGIIEVVLYYVEAEGLIGSDGMMFTATSFAMAAGLGTCAALFRLFKGFRWPRIKEFIGGIVLGVPNYLTIYLLVYLLGQGWDGSVLFPLNSIGILLLTAVVGVVIFKEVLDKWKLMGIALGACAIILLSLAI